MLRALKSKRKKYFILVLELWVGGYKVTVSLKFSQFYLNFICPPHYRRKEKQDIEDIEIPATKKVFLEQNKYKKQKSKEEKEYLDALNKEVKGPHLTKSYHFQ